MNRQMTFLIASFFFFYVIEDIIDNVGLEPEKWRSSR